MMTFPCYSSNYVHASKKKQVNNSLLAILIFQNL